MIGGLFVSAELRALKEFEWEVRNLREAAEVQGALEDSEGQGGFVVGKGDIRTRAEGVGAGFE